MENLCLSKEYKNIVGNAVGFYLKKLKEVDPKADTSNFEEALEQIKALPDCGTPIRDLKIEMVDRPTGKKFTFEHLDHGDEYDDLCFRGNLRQNLDNMEITHIYPMSEPIPYKFGQPDNY